MNAVIEQVQATTPDRDELHDFYAHYMEALDDVRLDDWVGFFAQDCRFEIIPRENYESGYGLCMMQADSKGMLLDRVQGILRTQIFGPRTYRRFVSGLRIVGVEANEILARQNVLLVQTLMDQSSTILLCGVAHDRLVRENGRLLFKQRIVVADSELVENSLIYPL